MKIWMLTADANNYDNLTFLTNDNREDYFNRFMNFEFDGRSQKEAWNPLPVRIIEEVRKSDNPSLSAGIPVFSKRAIENLDDLIKGCVEYLPLISTKDEYYIVNVVKVLNCIDYQKANVIRFSSSGRVMRFVKYSFLEKEIGDCHIFKNIDEPKSRVFVSETFRKKVLESGLEGFKFEEVWDSLENQ